MKKLIYILLLIPLQIFSQEFETETLYEYDNLNRLVKVVFNYGFTYEYTYDELGNRLTKELTVSLPYDNYGINTVGLSCVNSHDGKINISADLHHIYMVNIQSTENNYNETFYLVSWNDWNLEIEGLESGQYEIEILISGVDASIYQKKVRIVLDEPEPLKATRNSTGNLQTIQLLTGTAPYYISLNGKLIAETNETEYSFEANNGDLLEIRTSKDCEGVYSEILEIIEGITVYPNPANNKVNFIINSDKENITIKLIDVYGKTIEIFTPQIQGTQTNISIEHLPNGVYFIVLPEFQNQTFKIIKE